MCYSPESSTRAAAYVSVPSSTRVCPVFPVIDVLIGILIISCFIRQRMTGLGKTNKEIIKSIMECDLLESKESGNGLNPNFRTGNCGDFDVSTYL